MAKSTTNKEANGKGVQTKKVNVKGVASKDELNTRKNAVKIYGANNIFEHKPSYPTNPFSSKSEQNYTNLKNKAINTWNKGVDQQNEGVSKVSIGLNFKGSLNKAKSKVQDTYAEAYGKIVGAKDKNELNSKKTTTQRTKSNSSKHKNVTELYPNEPYVVAEQLYDNAENPAEVYEPGGVDNEYYQRLKNSVRKNTYGSNSTKSSSNNNKTTTKKSTRNKENWVETDDSVDGVTTKTSYGSRTIHQSGDKIYDSKYLTKDGITMTGIKGNQPTKGKNILNGSVSPYTKSEMTMPSDKSYNKAYKKTMSSKKTNSSSKTATGTSHRGK